MANIYIYIYNIYIYNIRHVQIKRSVGVSAANTGGRKLTIYFAVSVTVDKTKKKCEILL